MKIFPLRPPRAVKSEAMRTILLRMAALLKPGREADPHHGITLVPAKGESRPKPAEGSGSGDDCAGDGPPS